MRENRLYFFSKTIYRLGFVGLVSSTLLIDTVVLANETVPDTSTQKIEQSFEKQKDSETTITKNTTDSAQINSPALSTISQSAQPSIVEPSISNTLIATANLSDWNYNNNGDGSVTLTGYHGSLDNVVIPSSVGGLTVKIDMISVLHNTGQSKSIKKISIDRTGPKVKFLTNNLRNLFFQNTQITDVDFANADTSGITYFGSLFNGCSSLINVNLTGWNTSNATDFSYMFHGCTNLANIDVSSFNTQKGITFEGMFTNCFNLAAIDVSKFNTSNATNLSRMFERCQKLSSLNVLSFDTSKVQTMWNMFCDLRLSSLDLSTFNTSACTNFNSMFKDSVNLADIKGINKFRIVNISDMRSMFQECTKLIKVDLRGITVPSGSNMAQLFYTSTKTELNIHATDFSLINYNYLADNRNVTLADSSSINSIFDFSNTGWTGGDYGPTGNPWKISYTKDLTYEAPHTPGGTSSVNMDLTATDTRPNDGFGFTYKVSRTPFVGKVSGRTLLNPNLFFGVTLSNSDGQTVTGNLENMTSDQQTSTGQTGTVINLDQDNVTKTVMHADKGKSSGISKADIVGVYLTVPAASPKSLDTYESTVTWTLSDTP